MLPKVLLGHSKRAGSKKWQSKSVTFKQISFILTITVTVTDNNCRLILKDRIHKLHFLKLRLVQRIHEILCHAVYLSGKKKLYEVQNIE